MSAVASKPNFNFSSMDYHPGTEALTKYLCTRANTEDYHFARITMACYLGIVCSTMRYSVLLPGDRPVPVNIFSVGLMPSGAGKGVITGELEDVILKPLSNKFNTTWKDKREILIMQEAQNVANQFHTDPADEEKKVRKQWELLGEPYLYFEEATDPAFKQARSAMIKTPYGALNFIVDECFGVDAANAEVMESMIKTYDVGGLKQKLIKHSSDNPRTIDGTGNVPTNMLLFGTGSHLDDPVIHRDFMKRCVSGLARRAFFSYTREYIKPKMSAVDKLNMFKTTGTASNVSQFVKAIERMIDPSNEGRQFYMEEPTNIYQLEYQIHCENRADKLKDKVMKAEMTHRYMKVTKLAAIFAAWDDSDEITREHLQASMKIAEDADEHMQRLTQSVPLHARLAEYLADHDGPVTMAMLVAQLPWFKGSISAREEMLQLASEYGYSNSIILNQETRNGITFLSGEGIKENDLTKIIVAAGNHDAYNYQNGHAKWENLYKVVTGQGNHWTNHHLDAGHRISENVISGFNIIVLDIDNDDAAMYTPIAAAKELLADYSYLLYESKRSTPEQERYRIILPMSHTLKLPEEVYAKFMTNIYDWLPIHLDTQTNQRNRKWLGYDKGVTYNKGKLLPVLDFIPDTAAAANIRKQTIAMGDVTNMQRWFIRQITGGATRNNSLTKYAFMLIDAGLDQESAEKAVLDLNAKLPEPLPKSEISSTIFSSMAKKLAKSISPED